MATLPIFIYIVSGFWYRVSFEYDICEQLESGANGSLVANLGHLMSVCTTGEGQNGWRKLRSAIQAFNLAKSCCKVL